MVKGATIGNRQGAVPSPVYNAFTGRGARVSFCPASHSRGQSVVFVELAMGLPGPE